MKMRISVKAESMFEGQSGVYTLAAVENNRNLHNSLYRPTWHGFMTATDDEHECLHRIHKFAYFSSREHF